MRESGPRTNRAYVLIPPLPSKGRKRNRSVSSERLAVSPQDHQDERHLVQEHGSAGCAVDIDPELASPTYVIGEDEVQETAELKVHGESPGGMEGETPEDSDSEEEDEVPVRLLDDFCLYNTSTLEIIQAPLLKQIEFTDQCFGASGFVKPWTDTDEDSDGESESESSQPPPDRVRLTKIIEYNVYDICEGVLDGKMYIRTKFAWYILGRPSPQYRPFFESLWIRHRLAFLVMSAAQEDARLTYKDFCDAFPDYDESKPGIASAKEVIGRELVVGDLDTPETEAFVLSSAKELQAALGITRSALIRALTISSTITTTSSTPTSRSYSTFDDYSVSSKSTESEISSRKGPGKANKRIKSFIYTTPIISRLSENLFQVEMNSGDQPDSGNVSMVDARPRIKKHHFNAKNISWGRELLRDHDNVVYEDVNIDGVYYRTGEVVMVIPEEDYDGYDNHGRTMNVYGNSHWFCRIQYFFQNRKTKANMFHGHWLLHGSRTLINELSHPGALYFINSCEDNLLDCIFQKCNFRFLRPGEEEPPDHVAADTNEFHCSMLYDETHAHYFDLPTSYLNPPPEPTFCNACHWKQQEEAKEIPEKGSDSTFSYGGYLYHEKDFVYLEPETPGSRLLGIGQITGIKGEGIQLTVSVHHLKRYVDFLPPLDKKILTQFYKPGTFYDDRELVFTNRVETIQPSQLSGVCFVQWINTPEEADQWVQDDDHFYLNKVVKDGDLFSLPQSIFAYCKLCLKERKERLKKTQAFLKSNTKLVAMELFSGAGGLGLGMEMSGFVETRYAVEYFDSAALTFQKNHPNTKVYCQDTNLLLKQAIAEDSGEEVAPLPPLHKDLPCPKMPSKNDRIDFILGGPPCQGFSRMNHHRQADDCRTSMPCNMLSFAEYYSPSYFLLENVEGLLDFKLVDKRFDGSGSEMIQWGMLKFILRALIALGYQVKWKLTQAALYGVPQSRGRLIIWGTKRGLTPPEFPVPTHAFNGRGAIRPIFPGTKDKQAPAPSRSRLSGSNLHQFAPYLPITINDAIADLPAFEWRNPHLILPDPNPGSAEDRLWFGKRIYDLDAHIVKEVGERLDPSDGWVGFIKGRKYATPPLNRFQKSMRKGMKDNHGVEQKVQGQYNKCFPANLVEMTTSVPLKPKASHRDLPLILQPLLAQPGRRQERNVFFGRVGGQDHFKCALTVVRPNVKNLWPLHPLQKRIFTVRELARAQGFPDHYQFCSSSSNTGQIVNDQIKQIGNAVAVQFALALGKELGVARVTDWEQKQREDSPVF